MRLFRCMGLVIVHARRWVDCGIGNWVCLGQIHDVPNLWVAVPLYGLVLDEYRVSFYALAVNFWFSSHTVVLCQGIHFA